MKKIFLFLLIIFCTKIKTQIVFCPPGAEWHYCFSNGSPNIIMNEKVQYIGDSIIGPDTFKILDHSRYYAGCNAYPPGRTLIRQIGDTVFFRNIRTQNTWQILYNFNVQPGQGWQTDILKYPNTPFTYSFIVDSIKYVTINNMLLKRMYLGANYITERLGWNKFLFNFQPGSECEGDVFAASLCYQDNVFGLIKYTPSACDYPGSVGINDYSENNSVNLFPNPATELLNLQIDAPQEKEFVIIRINNVSGKEVESVTLKAGTDLQINTSQYKAGIYFIGVYYKGRNIETKKMVVMH